MHMMPWALVLALAKAGRSSPAKMAMMAITTNNSIRVKPFVRAFRRIWAVFNAFIGFHNWVVWALTLKIAILPTHCNCAFQRPPPRIPRILLGSKKAAVGARRALSAHWSLDISEPQRGSVPKPNVVLRLRDYVGLARQHDGNPNGVAAAFAHVSMIICHSVSPT